MISFIAKITQFKTLKPQQMKKYFYFHFILLLLSTYHISAQWLPVIEGSQNGIYDFEITNKGRVIINDIANSYPQNNTYLKYSDDNGKTWQPITDISLTNPNYRLGVLGKQGENLYAPSFDGIWKSTENGLKWALTPNTKTFTSYIVFASNQKYSIFAGYGSEGGLFLKENDAETWRKLNFNAFYISGVALRSDTILVSSQYDVYRGLNIGNTWSWAVLRVTPQGWANTFTDVESPDDKTIIATSEANGGCFISTDGGTNWKTPSITNAKGGLERSFDEIYINDKYWVLATTKYSGKIFISTNKGSTWVDFSAGLPKPIYASNFMKDVPINKIIIHNGMVWALVGNSIWKRPLNELTSNYLEVPTFLKSNTEMRNTNVISWDDNSESELGFIIERSINSENNFTAIGRTSKNITSFTDFEAEGGNTYYYRIKAHNDLSTSRYSDIIKVTNPPNSCKVQSKIITDLSYSRISFINEKTGFMLKNYYNYNQVLIRTDDAGKSWVEVPLHLPISNFTNMYFLDEKIGFLLDRSTGILDVNNSLMTIDGGITWRKASNKNPLVVKNYKNLIKTVPTEEFYINDSTGFAGSYYSLSRTGDFGKSWIGLGIQGGANQIFFSDDKTGFFIQQSGKIGKTIDGGDTWNFIQIPITFNQLNNLYASPDKKTIYFSGNTEYDNSPVILKTKDNGKSFEVMKPNLNNSGGISFISFAGNSAWIYTTKQELYTSDDELKTWKYLSSLPKIYRSKISFKGKWGLIGTDYWDEKENTYKSITYMSYDEGISWQKMENLKGIDGYFGPKVKIFDANKASVLYNDVVYRTNDRGKSWTKNTVPFLKAEDAGLIYYTEFINENVWYLSHRFFNEEYKLYKTTDGGRTWTHLSEPKNTYSVYHFLNENTIFIRQNGPAIYRSYDGGNSWKRIDGNFPQYFYPEAIHFVDNQTGFAGYRTTLLKTKDGGETWQEVKLDEAIRSGSIYQIKFFNKTNGYIRGLSSSGNMITNDGGETWQKATFEEIIEKNASLVNFDELYFDGYAGSSESRLIKYTFENKSVKPHQPNGMIDACQSDTKQTYSIDNNNSYSYEWKLSFGGTITKNRNVALIEWNSLGTYKLSVRTTNDCGVSDWQETDITVRGLATKPKLLEGELNPCPQKEYLYKLDNDPGLTYEWYVPIQATAKTNKNQMIISYLKENNTYKVKAIAHNQYCPSDTLSFDVNTKAKPPIPTIKIEQNNQLVSSSSTNNQWFLGNKQIEGATAQTFIPNQGTGQYSVQVKNECGSSMSLATTIIITASEEKEVFYIKLFPNPTAEKINVTMPSSIIQNINVIDTKGNILNSVYCDSDVCQLNLNNLKDGIYILQIKVSDNLFYRKIILSR